MKERDNLKDPGIEESIMLQLELEEYSGMVWTGFIWISIGGLL
jgi:hypothetical protein